MTTATNESGIKSQAWNEANEAASFTPQEIRDLYEFDLKNRPYRPLSKRERIIYSRAILRATQMVPSFKDAVALMRPFVDATADTAYTDKFSRVGLSYNFFYVIDMSTQATWLLHEAMHVMNSHFTRADSMGLDGRMMNIAGDLEINTTLQLIPSAVLEGILLPERYTPQLPVRKSMEFYATELMQNQDEQGSQQQQQGSQQQGDQGEQGQGSQGGSQGQGQGGSQGQGGQGSQGGEKSFDQAVSELADRLKESIESGEMQGGAGGGSGEDGNGQQGSHCDDATQERAEGADGEGIEKASTSDQAIARRNVAQRVADELKSQKSRGNGSMTDFLSIVGMLIAPPKVDWRTLLRNAVSRAFSNAVSGRDSNSFRRVNRRYESRGVFFPGRITYKPTAMIAVDTSGSMGGEDYRRVLAEVDGIVREIVRGGDKISAFSVDTTIQSVHKVASVSDLTLSGGGGTDMSIAFEYVNSLSGKESPDILSSQLTVALSGVAFRRSSRRSEAKRYKSIIVLTHESVRAESLPDGVRKLATVVEAY